MARIVEASHWDQATQQTVARIRAACLAEDGQDPLDEAAHLRLKHHGLTRSRLWLAGPPGSEQGFALLHQGALDVAVAPAGRRHGLGRALSDVAAPDARSVWSHGDHPGAAHIAAAHGFARARELWLMRRPAAPLPKLVPPPDVIIRSYHRGDEAELLRVNTASFAAHPEQGAMDATDLARRMTEPWWDPAGLLVAESAEPPGGLLGFHWTKRHSPTVGEVYVVAIAPGAQGRGLGRLLTLAGLHHLQDNVGVDEVILYVESDNHPARAVYEGLGFTHEAADTHVQYLRK